MNSVINLFRKNNFSFLSQTSVRWYQWWCSVRNNRRVERLPTNSSYLWQLVLWPILMWYYESPDLTIFVVMIPWQQCGWVVDNGGYWIAYILLNLRHITWQAMYWWMYIFWIAVLVLVLFKCLFSIWPNWEMGLWIIHWREVTARVRW